ncbi:DUF1501 domain-containing protein [bacterium]|nr:DUF1501 domain-containing protein [bacterium]
MMNNALPPTLDQQGWQNLQSRRALLKRAACGFGSLALAGLSQQTVTSASSLDNPLEALPTHMPARAKRIIFLFMQGGPSHVDSFDYKPQLEANHLKEVDIMGYRFNNFRKATKQVMMKPLWGYQRYGQTGKPVSALFPETAKHVDDLCFIHSMHTEGVAHGPSTLFLHTGSVNTVRPSVGSWVSYGLGSENANMPSFVTICPTARMGGPQNYGNAFLPAIHQGTPIGNADQPVKSAGIKDIINPRLSQTEQLKRFQLLQKLNKTQLAQSPSNDAMNANLNAFELAYRMQMTAPKLMDLNSEPDSINKLYGIGEKETDNYGRQCLMARKMAESGVRYIQVNYSDNDGGNPKWDQHSNLPRHEQHARAVDKPISGLLTDLKARGLLEDTLVWWGGEFGRTPFSQNNNGRDHNPFGFTVWLAGGGVKPGFSYGATDQYGYQAVENKVHMHDLHATVLHLMGLDHEHLTFRHAGRDYRLTDVYGNVVKDIIA